MPGIAFSPPENLSMRASNQSLNGSSQQIPRRSRKRVGELFSSIGMCVPTINLKINILSVPPYKIEWSVGSRNSLAETITNTNNNQNQGEMTDPQVFVNRVEVTEFHDEGPTASPEQIIVPPTNHELDKMSRDLLKNSVKGFLERPINFKNVDWQSNAIAGTKLATVDLPNNWMAIDMIKEKLSGFRFLKCDFRVKIQINAQPFNAGMIMAVYIPLANQLTAVPSSQYHFGGLTGYRRTVIDISESTSGELVIPYHEQLSYFDLLLGFGTLGTVEIYVYSPLTGMADVDMTVWLQAENVDVEMPTGLALKGIVQSQDPWKEYDAQYRALQAKNRELMAIRERYPDKKPDWTQVHACMSTLKRATSGIQNVITSYGPMGEEQSGISTEKRQPGNIETIAKKAGTIARAVGNVPGLQTISTVSSAVSDAVQGVASMFGWSKPTNPEFPTKVEQGFGRYLGNAIGVADTKSVALDPRNAVEVDPKVFGTEEDEMAISTIVSRPTYCDRFNLGKAMNPGTYIWSWPVCPSACKKTKKVNGDDSLYLAYNTFLSYLSGLFMGYRGEIKYIFRLVKTRFHSGRIIVMYVPGADETTESKNIDVSKVYKQVYDIRETNLIEFSVPYNQQKPWWSIRKPGILFSPLRRTYCVPSGMIYVQVLNALRNPTTVADHIDIVVETCGGKDFQFVCPAMNNAADTSESIVRSNEATATTPPWPYSGLEQSGLIPMEQPESKNLLKYGVGEAVESLRFLLKRYTYANFSWYQPLRPTDNSFDSKELNIANLQNQNPDVFTWVQQIYRFHSGSMRLAILRGPDTVNQLLSAAPIMNGFTTAVNPDDFNLVNTNQRSNCFLFPYNEPLVEVHVPFYQTVPMLPTATGLPQAADPDTPLNAAKKTFSCMQYNRGTALTLKHAVEDTPLANADLQHFRILRAIGEDFNFGYLIGPPITCFYYKNIT